MLRESAHLTLEKAVALAQSTELKKTYAKELKQEGEICKIKITKGKIGIWNPKKDNKTV